MFCKTQTATVGGRRAARLGSYLGVGLVLHALNQHALDHLQVVLLLVAEDSREVPERNVTKDR